MFSAYSPRITCVRSYENNSVRTTEFDPNPDPNPDPDPDPDPAPKTLVNAPRSAGPDGTGLVLV